MLSITTGLYQGCFLSRVLSITTARLCDEWSLSRRHDCCAWQAWAGSMEIPKMAMVVPAGWQFELLECTIPNGNTNLTTCDDRTADAVECRCCVNTHLCCAVSHSLSRTVLSLTLSHSVTCTCCYDQIKGTQDRDFSYSFSDSLSLCHLLCTAACRISTINRTWRPRNPKASHAAFREPSNQPLQCAYKETLEMRNIGLWR